MESVQRVVVAPHEEIGRVNPYVHGHFAEHLGELVYGGVFVGKNSAIANTNGVRHDVVDALKPLNIPVLRWPGGCFADDYHWRDGIGPQEDRPLRINRHWGMAKEDNSFGTHEFMEFCRALGSDPYFAGNLGSGTPAELRDWVEYCNYDGDSSLANERRSNGAAEPFDIRMWGIGNENWGCGGNMGPRHYAEEFSRYRSFVSNYSDTKVQAIACGQNDNDWEWTRDFFEHLHTRSYGGRLRAVGGFAIHYYCGTAGSATEYTDAQWIELLSKSLAIEGVLDGCRSIMDQFDPGRKIPLICDEWGAWHPVEKGKPTGGLYQQNTVRDACVAALSLDVFHNLADTVQMANIAQLINVLQAVLLVEEEKCIKTPTYHVFDLYQPHKGAQAVRFESLAEEFSDGGEAAQHCRARYLSHKKFALRAAHGSASVRDGQLCVTAVNPHPTETIELEVELHRAQWSGEVETVRLAPDNIRAYNTFDAPDQVKLEAPQQVQPRGGAVHVTLPPGGVARVRGAIG